jgi:hypothetical protein
MADSADEPRYPSKIYRDPDNRRYLPDNSRCGRVHTARGYREVHKRLGCLERVNGGLDEDTCCSTLHSCHSCRSGPGCDADQGVLYVPQDALELAGKLSEENSNLTTQVRRRDYVHEASSPVRPRLWVGRRGASNTSA